MRPRHVLALLVAGLLVLAACGDDDEDEPATTTSAEPPSSATAPAAPTTVLVGFWSGSIPPPYNHEYTLELVVEEGGVQADYRLVYRYREQLDEPVTGVDEDLAWQGALEPATAEQARALAADPGLEPPDETPETVGGPSWEIAVTRPDGTREEGVPRDTDAWHALGCAVDAQARAELGRSGTSQSC